MEIELYVADARENVEVLFGDTYSTVKALAFELGVEEMLPRRPGRQKNRSNVPTDSPEAYYRISIAVPFVDHMLTSLNDRFSAAVKRATKISLLLLKFIVGTADVLHDVFEMYRDDLPDAEQFQSGLIRWKNL